MQGRCWEQAGGVAALVLVAAAALLLALPRAGVAAPLPIASGGADWGIEKGILDYVEDLPGGTATATGLATRNPDGSFHFPLSGGSYDPDSRATVVDLAGGIRLSGGEGQLDLVIVDLSVEIAAGGSALFADVVSEASSDPASYPDVQLASLEASDVTPSVASGTTTWSAIPASLSPGGAAALAGLSEPGSRLEPFSFSYAGAGGKPLPEPWVAQGAPGFWSFHSDAPDPGEPGEFFLDPVRELLHFASPSGLRTLTTGTLKELGSIVPPAPLPAGGYAFDSTTGTVFALPDSTSPAPIRAFTFSRSLGIYTVETLPISGNVETRLAYDRISDTLYAIEGTGYPATPSDSTLTPTVALATRNGDGWTTRSYLPLDLEGRGVSGLAVSSDGGVVLTTHAYFEGVFGPETVFPSEAKQLRDFETEFSAMHVYNSTLPPTPSSGYTLGFAEPVAGPEGSVTLVESSPTPTSHVLRLKPYFGYFEAASPLDLGPGPISDYAVDPEDASGYAFRPESGEVMVVRDDAVVTRITAIPEGAAGLRPIAGAAGNDGVYLYNDVEGGRIDGYRHISDAPTIVQQPVGVVADVAGAADSGKVSFTAIATGNPTPSMRWQTRPAGSTAWTDLQGSGVTTLNVTPLLANAGRRFRVVFSNEAGSVATEPASIGIRVPGVGAGGGSAAVETADRGAPRPPAPRRSARLGARPDLRVGRGKTLVVGANGIATLARVTCNPPRPCRIEAAPRLRLRIGGEDFRAKVLHPSALPPSSSGAVRVKLPRPARRAIARTEAKAKLKLTVSSADQRLTRTVSAMLRGAGA